MNNQKEIAVNPNAANAESILSSWTTGGGKTAGEFTLAGTLGTVEAGYLELAKNLNPEFVLATAAKYFWEKNEKKSIDNDELVPYYKASYWLPRHQQQITGESSDAPAIVETSEQYKARCIALAQMQRNKLLAAASVLSPEVLAKVTKDLQRPIELTEEQKGVYEVMVQKEVKEREKFQPLDSVCSHFEPSGKRGKDAPQWKAIVTMEQSKAFFDLLVTNERKFKAGGNTFDPVTAEVTYFFSVIE